jgi:hypothetical protein
VKLLVPVKLPPLASPSKGKPPTDPFPAKETTEEFNR